MERRRHQTDEESILDDSQVKALDSGNGLTPASAAPEADRQPDQTEKGETLSQKASGGSGRGAADLRGEEGAHNKILQSRAVPAEQGWVAWPAQKEGSGVEAIDLRIKLS
jgi:hypothetical protein